MPGTQIPPDEEEGARAALPPAPTRAGDRWLDAGVHKAPHGFLQRFSWGGTIWGMRHSHTSDLIYVWSCWVRQFRVASAWSRRMRRRLPPLRNVSHPLGEPCSRGKLVFLLSFPWPLNSSWLQLLAFSLPGALPFPYTSTAQQDSHPVPVRLWCCNHCTGQPPERPARMRSRWKSIFFLKPANTTELAVQRRCWSMWLGPMGLPSWQA